MSPVIPKMCRHNNTAGHCAVCSVDDAIVSLAMAKSAMNSYRMLIEESAKMLSESYSLLQAFLEGADSSENLARVRTLSQKIDICLPAYYVASGLDFFSATFNGTENGTEVAGSTTTSKSATDISG